MGWGRGRSGERRGGGGGGGGRRREGEGEGGDAGEVRGRRGGRCDLGSKLDSDRAPAGDEDGGGAGEAGGSLFPRAAARGQVRLARRRLDGRCRVRRPWRRETDGSEEGGARGVTGVRGSSVSRIAHPHRGNARAADTVVAARGRWNQWTIAEHASSPVPAPTLRGCVCRIWQQESRIRAAGSQRESAPPHRRPCGG